MISARKLRRVYHKLNKKRMNTSKAEKVLHAGKVREPKKLFKTGGTSRQYNSARDTIKNSSGAIELEQGFMIQWGRVFNETDDKQDVRFRRKFKHVCFGVVLNRQNANSTIALNATAITSSGFEIDRHADMDSSTYVNYMAIGY